MAAFEVAQTVGGADIAATLDSAGYATLTIGATSGDGRISQDYDHLYLAFSSRNGHAAYYQYLLYEFNGDNAYKYSYTQMSAKSATQVNAREGSADGIRGITGDKCASNSLLADAFSTNTLWIANYSNSTNWKSTISTSAVPNNSDSDNEWFIAYTAGLFADTGAITQIMMKPGAGGAEFLEHSSYVLYGITGV